METTTTIWSVGSLYCDECKKPHHYIGDPLPEKELCRIICICNIEKVKHPQCEHEFFNY